MNVHFISIGGSAMHNLAIALHKKGYKVTGSDDEVFEPSKSRLAKHGLLPESIGWNPENIHSELDAVILGMHARADNPELIKAKELGLKIYSYPEYIYEQSKDKTRVVIGGSHGKTTITAMILHVLHQCNVDCDYLVGAQLAGFDTMVRITKDAPVIIIEGDEYLSSPIDRRPKFHLYKANLAILSGIAWDHINVFPTFENYVEQFKIFLDTIEPKGFLAYCELDAELKKLVQSYPNTHFETVGYGLPKFKVENGVTTLLTADGDVAIEVFGEHNLMNMNGARLICNKLGVSDVEFYKAIASFKGASKRLELVAKNDQTAVYKDFAHSPSKLKATTAAMKAQFPERKLIAAMELHTFSSLNKNFLKEYDGSMATADEALVYFNHHTIEHKKLEPISEEQVKEAFNSDNIQVFTDSKKLETYLLAQKWKNANLLLMSSGNFDGIDFKELAEKVLN
ncbi:UDP-N-acetylmuramate--L-alanine ligase [Solitalea canadensis]|uniref:UDP-N-acetylmuramate-alanine ligase n=1 Tax=Solitalea canadensis (strain ATCC 29591 / DSM 3403 / JCM 21819 / LMG 8368 / NBRC 15130 / NCIMB 12057 / USAM 9D) TaxID=929556 RepID=H8KPL2_SOLCM|nr:Mur ligase domain-containing protein [Solitalea canadensis]AFD05910.1 UDP-N-acetylmuramate-alanine ligase [Solitalea canadensis DSM 3403]